MGKNFYGKRIPTTQDYHKLAYLVTTKPITSALGFISNMEETIHIGKSSAGWEFLWQYNDGRYYKNLDELLAWLKTVQIVDEYGGEYTFDEFYNVAFNRTYNGRPAKKHSQSQYGRYLKIGDLEFVNEEFF